jgi:hypothetical protein
MAAPGGEVEERRVSAPELRRFCAALVASPERMSVAASTSARPPARVRVSFAVPPDPACAAAAAASSSPGGDTTARSAALRVAVRELEYAAGGLGFRLFPSALWLSAWLAALPHRLAHASLLELGAGLGLVGLTAACTGLCASVTLTDFNPGLLTALAAAAEDNGVAARVRVAHCDWAEEAAVAGRGGAAQGQSARDTGGGGAGGDAWAFARDANPEFFRVRAQLDAAAAAAAAAAATADAPAAAEPHSASSGGAGDASASSSRFARLPPGETFSLIVATEVLYEMFAAVTLPALLSARLCRRGRFVTLMAIRDAALLCEFISRLQAAGLRVALRPLADMALPPADGADDAADDAACAGANAGGAGADAPLCGGAWEVGDAGWRAKLARGGRRGGALEAAWVEAQQCDADADAAAAARPCCSRAARGMACPCAARRARPPAAP